MGATARPAMEPENLQKFDMIKDSKWVKMTNISCTVSASDILQFIKTKIGNEDCVNTLYLYPNAEDDRRAQFAFIECKSPDIASQLINLRGEELREKKLW